MKKIVIKSSNWIVKEPELLRVTWIKSLFSSLGGTEPLCVEYAMLTTKETEKKQEKKLFSVGQASVQ